MDWLAAFFSFLLLNFLQKQRTSDNGPHSDNAIRLQVRAKFQDFSEVDFT